MIMCILYFFCVYLYFLKIFIMSLDDFGIRKRILIFIKKFKKYLVNFDYYFFLCVGFGIIFWGIEGKIINKICV